MARPELNIFSIYSFGLYWAGDEGRLALSTEKIRQSWNARKAVETVFFAAAVPQLMY